jgi:uncharacterized protein (TIGR03435 family)
VPLFEVTSVRVNDTAAMGVFSPMPGRFAAAGVTLRELIIYAYRVNRRLQDGGPSWIDRTRFDVSATASQRVGLFPEMVQRLLEDRFKLRVRREARDTPVYALVRARADGSLGPQLRLSNAACTADPSTPCRRSGGSVGVKATGIEWSALGIAQQLSVAVDRQVVDKTKLVGRYDVALEWSPVLTAEKSGDEQVSVFTALQEQLGLRLVPDVAPVEFFVIDSASMPEPN